ncbi:thiamine-phosphate kinase [Paenibacillus sp. GCM10027626]|uniref:thiamine-phosphate kinase n=1 Tax=Paenibacillus sp. GCM10027626 TaxID=3273411 RepID=UPI00362564DB
MRRQGVVCGIGDDTAVIDPQTAPADSTTSWQWLMTMDTMVETIHFNEVTMGEADIGWKALAANISDIAAMGGIPRHALVSVSVPRSWGADRMRRLYDGLYACAQQYNVAIIGGDTTAAPAHLVLSVTVAGVIEQGKAITRSGARPGDAIFVTGLPGRSAAGLHWLTAMAERERKRPIPLAAAREAEVEGLVAAHRRPQPSVEAARLLAARGTVTSLNDVSDGVASEAWEIAQASGVQLRFRQDRLPISGSMAAYAGRAGATAEEWFFYGGEDYVLLGTIASDDAGAAKEALNDEGIPFFVIGAVEAGEAAVTMDCQLQSGPRRIALEARGYNHFA